MAQSVSADRLEWQELFARRFYFFDIEPDGVVQAALKLIVPLCKLTTMIPSSQAHLNARTSSLPIVSVWMRSKDQAQRKRRGRRSRKGSP